MDEPPKTALPPATTPALPPEKAPRPCLRRPYHPYPPRHLVQAAPSPLAVAGAYGAASGGGSGSTS